MQITAVHSLPIPRFQFLFRRFDNIRAISFCRKTEKILANKYILFRADENYFRQVYKWWAP